MSEEGKQNLRKHKKNQICVLSWEELQQRLEQVTEHIKELLKEFKKRSYYIKTFFF